MQRVSRSWVKQTLPCLMDAAFHGTRLPVRVAWGTHPHGEGLASASAFVPAPDPTKSLQSERTPRQGPPAELTLPFLFINKHLCRVTKMY